MQRFVFHLRLTPEQYLAYYRGHASKIVVTCSTGGTLQFPAVLLRKFVTPEGIHGNFELTCDENRRGAELKRLGPVR